MHWIYLINEFHNLSWITEINELFHDILIYWDAPVSDWIRKSVYFIFLPFILNGPAVWQIHLYNYKILLADYMEYLVILKKIFYDYFSEVF